MECPNYHTYINQKIRSPKYRIELAREMRKNLTLTEKVLWHELQNKKLNGYKFSTGKNYSRVELKVAVSPPPGRAVAKFKG